MSYENDKMSTGITRVLWWHGVTLIIPLFFLATTLGNVEIGSGMVRIVVVLWLWAGWVFLFQLIYVIPLLIFAKVNEQKETLKGILVAFGVTFLLSGLTCGGSWWFIGGVWK